MPTHAEKRTVPYSPDEMYALIADVGRYPEFLPWCAAARTIDVEYLDGPFRYLKNHWRFLDAGEGRCEIDFFVDFEFRSTILQKLIGLVFTEAMHRIVRAFERRAEALYGVRARV